MNTQPNRNVNNDAFGDLISPSSVVNNLKSCEHRLWNKNG